MAEYLAIRDGGKTDEAGFMRMIRKLFNVLGPVTSADLVVTQRGAGANKSVDVAAGDAFISYSNHCYHVFSTATKNLVIADNSSGNPRIDVIVAYVDLTVVSSASANNPNALKFMVVQGTPAGSPSAPDDTAVQTAVGAGNPFIRLANVAVANGFTSIVNADLTDTRTVMRLQMSPSILQIVMSNNLGTITATNLNVVTYWGEKDITPKSASSTIYAFLFSNGLQNGSSGRLNTWMVQDTASGGTTGTAIGSASALAAAQDSTSTNGTSSGSYIGSFAPGNTTKRYIKALAEKQDSNTTWIAGANSADSRILLIEVLN